MPEASPAPAQASLDELMLAMDVVDTLRHNETLVARELAEETREAALIARLRSIYHGQGIEVSDAALAAGVKAMKESRFAYTPPPPGLATTLAKAWVNRGRIGRRAAAGLGALVAALLAYQFLVVRPAEQHAEQARVAAEQRRADLAERLPRRLAQAHAAAAGEARVEAARIRADQLLADGRAALAREDAAAAQQVAAALERLRDDLAATYTLRIVSRPGEQSGVWRIPERNPNARNYYLIIEAVAPDGSVLTLPVTSEEDGRTRSVARFGVRVSPEAFEAVRRDKNDDGIVQNNRLGEKRRGRLDPDFAMPVTSGRITEW